METGKTGRYFKYALGEIILVVIGILIALQINNWNEDRKAKLQGDVYIGEIYKDLEKDILVLNQVVERLKEQSLSAERLLEVFESPNKTISDTLLFSNDFSLSSWPLVVDRDNNTFIELVTVGKGNVINDNVLIEKLHDFYKHYDASILNFNEFPKEVRFNKRAISLQLGTKEDFKFAIENGYLRSKYISKIINTPQFYPQILGIYKSCYYNISFFEDVLREANEVIAYLKINHFNKISKAMSN